MANFGKRKSDFTKSDFALNYNIKELEEAISLIEKYEKAFDKMAKATGKKQEELNKLVDRYLKKLDQMNVSAKDKNSLIKQYQYLIAYREEENKQREEALKLQEEENKQKAIEWELQQQIEGKTRDEIKLVKEKNKVMKDTVELAAKAKDDDQRDRIVNSGRAEIDALQRRNNIAKAKKSANLQVIGSLLGDSNFSGTVEAVNNGTYGITTAAKIFSKAVEMFRDAVKESINANYNSTEKTLNSITASNRMSWSSGSFSFGGKLYTGSSQLNNAVNDRLWSEGLYNNIANTDVIEAAAKLTSEGGMDIEKALAKGYEDTVIKYIVPYLDTASETFNNLEFIMPGMSKNIASIAITTRDQIGESRYLSKYAEELAQLLEPVSLQANEELYSEEFQQLSAMTEAMLKAGVFQSPAEAQKYLHQAFGIYSNPSGKMTNGSTIEQWTAINALQSGNIDSPSGIMSALMGNTTEALSWAGNDSVLASIIQNAYGLNSFRGINIENMDDANKILDDFKTKTAKELDEIYKTEKGNADNYNTNSDKLEKALLNATAEIGDFKTVITDKVWQVGEYIVSSITGYIGAKIVLGTIGKSLGLMGGSAAGGAGSGILAAGGGIAVGLLAGVVVGKIAEAIMDAKQDKHYAQANKELYDSGSDLYGNTVATSVMSAGNSENAFDLSKPSFGGVISAGSNALFKGVGMVVRNTGAMFSGNKNEARYKNFLEFLDIAGIKDKQTREEMNLAWLLLADYGNGSSQLGSIGMSHSDLIAYLKSEESPGVFNARNHFYESPLYGNKPLDSGGNRIEELSTRYMEKLKEEVGENFHRQGLSEVPYDNYVASLHQGEAVLTASTANELRNLLDEYRNTTHTSANLDAVIQNQTNALCSKLDDVIRAISTSNISGISTPSSEYQARAHNLLRTSMLTMRNTKDALS